MSDSTSTADKRTIYQAPPGKAPQNPMPKWWLASVILGGLVAFLLIVGRAEISRWYVASAKNAIEDHRYEDAVTAADKGVGWDPDYTELINLRAFAKTRLNKFEEAIADLDQIIELASKTDPFSEEVLRAKASKAVALQRLDRYPEAIKILSELVRYREQEYRMRNDTFSLQSYAMSLNNRAYIEAQAHVAGAENIDIELALHDIEKAIDLKGEDDPVMMDTLGYLELLNGKHEGAFYHLDQATKLTEIATTRIKEQLEAQMQRVTDQRPYQEQMRELDEQFSIILHHRGEAQRALGREEEAKADIDRAVELGFDPEEGIW